MVKCPFCHFDNEEGALYCEQCKSDLAAAAPVAPAIPVAQAETLPGASVPHAAPVLVEAVAEAVAEPIPTAAYDTIPVATAEPIAPMPVMAEPIPVALQEATPVVTAQPAEVPPSAPAAPPQAAAPAPSAPTPAPASPVAKPAEAAPPAAAGALPPGAQPRLLVLRGQKRNVEYPIYEGLNFIGRADEKPVDIDLEDQEPPDRIWCSRQHACISFENDQLAIEDLNSANGTYVNRNRIYPGQKRPLAVNDIIQIGNVQLKVLA
jgi:pSer/pThr/pTyr-binding forkhead associated (FHA) protein